MFSGYLDKKFYPDHQNNWDDQLFRERILRHLTAESVVLDIGAGAGLVQQMHFKGQAKEVLGVDPDERVLVNAHLTRGYKELGDSMPFFEDDKFDLVFCDNVLEHLSDPNPFFKEVRRVLKPGGYFLVKTPNKTHYMPLIASMTPACFHGFYNKLRGRDEQDTFPTLYRVNTKGAVRRAAEQNGFRVASISTHEGRPEYLRIFAPAYLCGIAYERVVNALGIDSMKLVLVTRMSSIIARSAHLTRRYCTGARCGI